MSSTLLASTPLCFPPTPRNSHSRCRLTYQQSPTKSPPLPPSLCQTPPSHPPPPSPFHLLIIFNTNTDAVSRIFPSPHALHPYPIHPHLPPQRMEPRMLSLPQLLPLLKGTPAPLSRWLFSAETIDDNKPIKKRNQRNQRPQSSSSASVLLVLMVCVCVCLRAIQPVCVSLCVYLLQISLLLLLSYILPDNTEGSEHAQWDQASQSCDLQLTALLLLLLRNRRKKWRKMALPVFMRLPVCVFCVCLAA